MSKVTRVCLASISKLGTRDRPRGTPVFCASTWALRALSLVRVREWGNNMETCLMTSSSSSQFRWTAEVWIHPWLPRTLTEQRLCSVGDFLAEYLMYGLLERALDGRKVRGGVAKRWLLGLNFRWQPSSQDGMLRTAHRVSEAGTGVRPCRCRWLKLFSLLIQSVGPERCGTSP